MWPKGKPRSLETRAKIALALKGTHVGSNNPYFGKHPSLETRAKLSLAHKGKPRSLETRAKLSLANKGINNAMYGKTGVNNPFYGKHHSLEVKQKQSARMKGIRRTSECKNHMSVAQKGRHHSLEARTKISESHRGMCTSPETKVKLSLIRKQWWANHPNLLEEHMRKIMSCSSKRPNGIEKQLISLISRHSLPFRYTGRGDIWINGQNPDFVNVNGKKTVIELNGCYWHHCKICGFGDTISETKRIEKYAEYGFRTIEIWEHNIKDEFKLLRTMKEEI